jgi:hypothetical protein
MDNYDIIIGVQKIIKDYDDMPLIEESRESLVEEVSEFISKNVSSKNDIKLISDRIKLGKWENI